MQLRENMGSETEMALAQRKAIQELAEHYYQVFGNR